VARGESGEGRSQRMGRAFAKWPCRNPLAGRLGAMGTALVEVDRCRANSKAVAAFELRGSADRRPKPWVGEKETGVCYPGKESAFNSDKLPGTRRSKMEEIEDYKPVQNYVKGLFCFTRLG